MAVNVTKIDGQNVGLRLVGQASVAVMTLNLTTGEVTSAYFNSSDLSALKLFATRLLPTVPVSSRAAAAVGLLSRLCAVSPADASSVTVSATVVGSVATLTATISASPATIILTIPFSPSGGVMISGVGGSGGGSSTDTNLVQLALGEAMNVGDPVAVQAGVGVLARANDVTRMPAVGVIDSLVDPTTAKVRVGGVFTSGGGYTTGAIHFISATGTISSTPPSVAGQIVQGVGFALSATTLAIAPSTILAIR